MANSEHLKILKQGVEVWNKWREEHAEIAIDLKNADLERAYLTEANFRKADLTGATLREAFLSRADLTEATLTEADLWKADLWKADLTNCNIYGVSVWNVNLKDTTQKDLVITPPDEPEITVDNLEVAQFIYLLLNNENVRKVIDTITSKVVLILGRFTPERKKILDAIKEELRHRNYSPIIFDFDKPASKDVTGTVETLARMARFIIADLTDPSSIPHELATVVPFLRTTPVQPLRLAGTSGCSMVDDLKSYPWVLKTYEYKNSEQLIGALARKVIGPAEAKVKKLTKG